MKQQCTVKRSLRTGAVASWVLIVSGACSAGPVDLGDGRLGVDRSALESYAAVWEGYVEAYNFHSGSDRVVLTLDARGNGKMRFGAAEPVPVPTDPELPFPFERFADHAAEHYDFGAVPAPIEGFDYDVTGAVIEDERLRAASPSNQIFAAGCALQTPVLLDPQPSANVIGGSPSSVLHYGCLDNHGYAFFSRPEGCFDNDSSRVSCPQAYLCFSFCDCSESECTARSENIGELRFDGALSAAGDRLEGTLVGVGRDLYLADERVTVRLTRVAAAP